MQFNHSIIFSHRPEKLFCAVPTCQGLKCIFSLSIQLGYQDSKYSIPPENPVSHLVTGTISNIIPRIQMVQWKNIICTTWQCDFLRYFTQIHDFAMQREILYYNIAFVNSERWLAKSRVDITQCQHGTFFTFLCAIS